jgi:inhibitor of KinA sporulation pathway (predicted exonuclease)
LCAQVRPFAFDGEPSVRSYDKQQLQKDAERLGLLSPLDAYMHTNLKKAFAQRHRLGKPWPGMRRAIELCGLSIEGAYHRGIDDARNIARMLPWLLDPKLKGTIVRQTRSPAR